VPLDPAYKAGLAGHVPVKRTILDPWDGSGGNQALGRRELGLTSEFKFCINKFYHYLIQFYFSSQFLSVLKKERLPFVRGGGIL